MLDWSLLRFPTYGSGKVGATDARCFHDCGKPVAVIGVRGRGAHAVDEAVSVSGIDAVADLLVAFLSGN